MEIIEQKVERLYETGIDLVARTARICYRSKGNPENNETFVKGLIKKGHLSPLEFWKFENPIVISKSKRDLRRLIEMGKSGEESLKEASKYKSPKDWIAMEITTNIGIARELMRHRVFSYCQESTRYINYHKRGGIQFIPSMEVSEEISKLFTEIEKTYYNKTLFDKPEIARGILPLDTATTLVMGGFKSDWDRMLKLRLEETAGRVHPQMKELAQLIKNELKK